MALSRLMLQTRKLACAPISRTMRPMVAVRSVATKAPEVADYAVEERVSTLLLYVSLNFALYISPAGKKCKAFDISQRVLQQGVAVEVDDKVAVLPLGKTLGRFQIWDHA